MHPDGSLRHHNAPKVGNGYFSRNPPTEDTAPSPAQHHIGEHPNRSRARKTGFLDLRLREYMKLLSIMSNYETLAAPETQHLENRRACPGTDVMTIRPIFRMRFTAAASRSSRA